MPLPALYGRPTQAMPGMNDMAELTPEASAQLSYGELGKGAVRTLRSIPNQVQAMVGQYAEPVAPEFGRNLISDAVRSTLQDGRTYAPAVASHKDVNDGDSALLYGGSMVGQMLPYVPLALTTAGLGRMAAGEAGAHAAATGTFLPINAGDYAIQMAQDPEAQAMTPMQRAGLMTGVGGAQSALEGMIPAGAVNRLATPRANVPRTLGGAISKVAGETAQGIGATGLEEGAQALVGQVGQQTYAPGRDIDWDAVTESAIGGMVGVAPHAPVHAAAASMLDASAAGAKAAAPVIGKGVDLAKEYGGKAADAAAPYVGKAMDKAKPYTDAMKKDAEDLRASVVEALDGMKQPEDTSKEPAFKDVVDEARAPEQRFSDYMKKLSTRPKADTAEGELNERSAALRAMGAFVKSPAMKEKLLGAADALDALQDAKSPPTAEDITAAWEATQDALRVVRNGAANSKGMNDKLTKVLDTAGMKFSRLGPSAQSNAAADVFTRDGVLEKALSRAFKRAGLSGNGYLSERAKIGEQVRAYVRHMQKDPMAAFDFDTVEAMRDHLSNALDEHAGAELHDDIHALINKYHEGNEQNNPGKSRRLRASMSHIKSIENFVRSSYRGDQYGPTDVVEGVATAVDKYDELTNKIDSGAAITPKLLGQKLYNLVAVNVERAKTEGRDANEQAVARMVLDQMFREHMEQNFKDPARVADNIRQLREAVLGHRKEVQSIMGDMANESGLADGSDEDQVELEQTFEDDDDLKREARNKTRLTTVDSEDLSPTDVLDTVLPATAHASFEHGEYGEIGHLRQVQERLTSTVPGGQTSNDQYTSHNQKTGNKGAQGYAEVGRVNVLEHLSNQGAEDPVRLQKLMQDTQAVAGERADKIAKEIQDAGHNPDEIFDALQAAYNGAVKGKKDALAKREPWEVFDARAHLRDVLGDDKLAQLGGDYYWNRVRSKYDGAPRDYFSNFPHYYVTVRNNAGGHEQLNEIEINKGMVRDSEKVEGERTHNNGYLKIETNDGERTFDIPRLMEHSLGKVRTRDETDEESYVRGLELPDGTQNMRYISDLRSAYAALALSLIGAKHLKLTEAQQKALLSPKPSTMLVRPTNGVGAVTYGDLDTGGKAAFKEDEAVKYLVDAEGMRPTQQTLKRGILLGTNSSPIMGAAGPVGINVPALVKRMAKTLGLDYARLGGDEKLNLMTLGLHEMIKSGEIVEGTLRLPYSKDNASGAMNVPEMYDHLNIGDFVMYRSPETAEKLRNASFFAADPANISIAKLERIAKSLEGAISTRAGKTDDQFVSKEIAEANAAAFDLAIALRDPALTPAGAKAIQQKIAEIHSQVAKLNERKETTADDVTGNATAAELERMRAQEDAEYKRGETDRGASFYDKEAFGLTELQGKLLNIQKAIEEKAGWENEPWVADDGVSGEHEAQRGGAIERVVKNSGKGDGSHEIAETRKTVGQSWQLLSQEVAENRNIERQLGNVRDKVAPTGSAKEVRAAMTKPKKVSVPESIVPGAKVPDAPAEAQRKKDWRLEAFMRAVRRGDDSPNFSVIQPNMYHAFYKAMDEIGTDHAKKVQARIAALADIDGVDAKTGKTVGGTKKVLNVSGASKGVDDGPVTLVRTEDGLRYDVMRDGERLGRMLAANVLQQTGLSDAEIKADFSGGKVSVGTEAKELEPYDGDANLPKRGKSAMDYRTTRYSRFTTPDGTTYEGDSAAEIVDLTTKLFGRKVDAKVVDELFDKEGNEVFGQHGENAKSPLGFFMRLSMKARGALGSNALHESLHGLFTVLKQSPEGKTAIEKVMKTINTPIMQKRILDALTKLGLEEKTVAGIMKDIAADPEEGVAYAFQLRAMGLLNLAPEQHSFVKRVSRFFKDLLHLTSEHERTEAFFDAFLKGELGTADFKPTAIERAFKEKKGDEILRNAMKALEPFKKIMHTVFDSSVQALERFDADETRELLKAYAGPNGFIKRSAQRARQYSTQANAILEGHKPEELQRAIADIYAGKVDTPAAKAIKSFMERVNRECGRPADYMPQILDHEKIKSRRKEFEQALADYTPGGQKLAAHDVMDLISDLGFTKPHTELKFAAQFKEELSNWIQSDPTKFFRAFIVTNARTATRQEIFGNRSADTILNQIKAKYGEGEMYYKARDFVDGMEGRMGKSLNPRVRDLMKVVMTAGNVVTLPFALFTAAVDPFHLASRSGSLADAGAAYGRGLKSIVDTIGSAFGNKRKNTAIEQLAEDIGAIEHAMLTDVLGDTYLGDTADGWTKKVNDWFFKANFLDGWTRQMRVAAVAAGQRFILSHAKGESPHSARFMQEMGLTKDDVKTDKDGTLILNDKIARALNQFVDESIVRPDQTTNAIWMNDPRFMLVAHMKRFTFAFNDVVLARAMREVGEGNLHPLAMLGASIPAILMADMGKHLLKGDLDTWMNNKTTMQWFEYGLNRSGLNGKAQFGMDAVADVQSGGTPLDSAMGPDVGLIKKWFGQPHQHVDSGGGLLHGLIDAATYAPVVSGNLQKAKKA